jgi:P-type conjugative transfer protein TrbG
MDASLMRNALMAGAAVWLLAPVPGAHAQPVVPDIVASAQAGATVTTAAPAPSARPQLAATGAPANTAAAQAAPADVPRTDPPKVPLISPDPTLTAKQKAGVATARRWISKFQKPKLDENGVVVFMFDRGQASVVCAVNHVCDIALQPGEVVSPPLHVGDSADWFAHQAFSGVGGAQTTHVTVKPKDAGLTSNIMIYTNRRTYSIELVSTSRDYMPMVKFEYPDDDDSMVQPVSLQGGMRAGGGSASSSCDQPVSIPPSEFHIEKSSAPWRPVQAYAVSTPVGMKLCIDFPSDINSHNLPALVALGDDGTWFTSPSKQIVNFSFVNRRFVVEGLLNRVQLIDGVGDGGKSVLIERVGR